MRAPLRILLGPTASGKERTALILAERLGAAIISVDSMKIYRGMDIGTATPGPEVRSRVEHRCLDIASPHAGFSVAQYRDAAEAAMAELEAAGRPFLLSGGTALYHKVLTEGLFEGPGADPALRRELTERADRAGGEALHAELAGLDPAAAARIHPHDVRRLVRALEVCRLTGRPLSAHQTQFGSRRRDRRIAMVGLRWPRPVLHERIHARVERMLQAGLEEEARRLWERPEPLSRQAAAAVGYAELYAHFAGSLDRASAIEQIRAHTRQLAKSQMTWFRKFPCRWIEMAEHRSPETVADRVEALWAETLAAE
jgi:tRNA dimethylallyltransferase